MKQRIFNTLVVCATLACGMLIADTAVACDWAPCGEPADIVPADKTTVPANASVVWSPWGMRGEVDDVIDQLVLTDSSGNEIDVEISEADLPRFYHWGKTPRVVTPIDPLQPGTEYTLATPNTECVDDGEQPIESIFVADDAQALPEGLGTISASPLERTDIELAEDGSCAHTQDVISTDVELVLDAQTQPWANALVYETVVDGEFWGPSHSSGVGFPIGSSWVGRGQDKVFAICNDEPYSEHSYLLPGVHTIKMRAFLPGTDVVLESNELTVAFDCANAGVDPTPSADAGTAPDADSGADAGTNNSENANSNSSGSAGGCTTGHGPTPGAALLLVGTLALATMRRR